VFPIRDTIPHRRAPVMTVLLIVINLLVFFYEVSLPPHVLERFIEVFGVVPQRFSLWARMGGSPADPFRFAPILTSMFVHGGWAHVLGNMWFLWIFGDNVEDVLGRPRFLVFYLLCGGAAAFAQIAASPLSAVPTVGASGAIAGVLGAYFWLFPKARILTFIPIFIIPYFVEIPALVFLGIWFVLQLISGVAEVGTRTLHGGVAWWAHAAGFIVGIVLLWILRPSVSRRRAPLYRVS
jgi:membrane associated rhomboid family serine protease